MIPTRANKRQSIVNAGSKVSGMEEAVAFLGFMKSSEKNRAIRKAYVIATKAYRSDLKSSTPVNSYPSRSKGKIKHLRNTVGMVYSKKYDNQKNLISPMWVGHIVKRGAFHQHLLVRGTKAWQQDSTPKAKGGKRKKYFTFLTKSGTRAYGYKKKAVKGNPYVDKVRDRHVRDITSNFGDSFIAGMRKEARTAKYKGYLSY